LENTDYRQPKSKKKKVDSRSQNESGEFINKAIAYFRIDNGLNITKLYKANYNPPTFKESIKSKSNINNGNEILSVADPAKDEDETNDNHDKFKWSFDISNLHNKKKDKKDDSDVNEAFILIAISRIDVNKDMKNKENDKKNNVKKPVTERLKEAVFSPLNDNRDFKVDIDEKSEPSDSQDVEPKKGIAIYRLELTKNGENGDYDLNKITRHYSDKVSGICRFIQASNEVDKVDKVDKVDEDEFCDIHRFIILNFHGIYNFVTNDNFDFFNLNEKFEYPPSIRRELNNWFTVKDNCMKRLLSCIYDRYFLVTQYKNDVQSLEGKV
jgi:hypothetical protein